jgi:hypothetical protein
MNLRFVEAFYWAVTLKSVTRASEKLFITQSALSSRIAALETELGTLLLDRRDKQFRLTTAGARFQRHAERLLNLQREIKAEFGSGAERPTTSDDAASSDSTSSATSAKAGAPWRTWNGSVSVFAPTSAQHGRPVCRWSSTLAKLRMTRSPF